MSVKHIPLLLVLVLALVSCDGHSPTAPFGGHSAALSGVVTDPYGQVWGGVTVGIVQPDRDVVADGLTDDHGKYSVKRLNPGPYRVWLQLGRTGPGYFVADVDLREGQNTLNIVSR